MTWLPLAAAAAVLYALQGAWTKRLTRSVAPAVATWAIFAFALPLLALYLFVRGVPEVGAGFWPVLAVNTLLYLVSFRLYVSALQVGELGLTYPLLALTPVLVVPVEWILLGERAGLAGIVGIVLVTGGVYLLNLPPERRTFLEPFRAVARDPGCRRMLGVALIWAVSGTLDRVAVLRSSPAFYSATVSLALTGLLLPWAWRSGETPTDPERDPGGRGDEDALPGLRTALRRHPAALALQGLLFAAMFASQMEALQLSLAAYVLTVKRSGTLLGVLLGGLFFRERRMGLRLAGTAVVLAGVYLVATS